jgi:ATP-grasp domain-containing protein
MAYKIYYRRGLMEEEELTAAEQYFPCVSLLTDIEPGDQVIYRYSLFPFPKDQENEILNVGAKPINSFNQHLYVADLQNWVMDLAELTPITWDRLELLPETGPFVLKGETNSRKSNWKQQMFAETKTDAIRVHSELLDDSLIGQQKIYIRQYVPLHTYMTGLNGLPITKEFRFFVLYGQILCGEFYWQNYVDELPIVPEVNEVPLEFLQQVIKIVSPHINFFVVDVAQTQKGDWIVIELNDGSCSGLSCINPQVLYSRLKEVLETQ